MCPIYHRKKALALMGLSHYFYATSGHDIDMNNSDIFKIAITPVCSHVFFSKKRLSLVGKDRPNITGASFFI